MKVLKGFHDIGKQQNGYYGSHYRAIQKAFQQAIEQYNDQEVASVRPYDGVMCKKTNGDFG